MGTQRVINPIQVKRFKGELVLVAHCQLRNDRRTFKLDRIVQLTRIDQDAQVPPKALECPEPDADLFRTPRRDVRIASKM
jgi:predicted DNA-binding transcriptional regulator YafY